MTDVKISQLQSGNVATTGYVPVSRSDGSVTEKLTVEDIGSINIKQSVRLATVTNVGQLFGTIFIDGLPTNEGDRILVKNQSAEYLNGIYIAKPNFWIRSSDFDSSEKMKQGSVVFVLEGVQNKTTSWILENATITIGVTSISFIRISTGNIQISGNLINSTNPNGNVFIVGTGSGSVFVENIRITTRTISTSDADSNLIISTEGLGSVLLNSRSANPVVLGNLQVRGDTITSTETSNGNIILSPNGNIVAGNVQINGSNIRAASGNLNISSNVRIGNLLISPDSITSNGNILLALQNGNVVIGSQSGLGPMVKLFNSDVLFPIATTLYVDSSLNNLDLKSSVRAATTSNISLSQTQTIDGVNLIVGDRVLVKNQTIGTQNGIYSVGTNTWNRSVDSNNFIKFNPNMFVFVEEGNSQADTGWILTNNRSTLTGNVIIDQSYNFAQFTGSSNSGIDGSYTGSTAISTLGTISNGTWNGSSISVSYGGTGATDAETARTNLGVSIGTDVQAYSALLGSVSSDTYAGTTSTTTLGIVSTGTWNGSVVDISYGGTGATDAETARTNLGVSIGTDVQAYSANLAELSSGNASVLSSGTIIIPRKISEAEVELTIPSAGEIIYINDDSSIKVGDGISYGGIFISNNKYANASAPSNRTSSTLVNDEDLFLILPFYSFGFSIWHVQSKILFYSDTSSVSAKISNVSVLSGSHSFQKFNEYGVVLESKTNYSAISGSFEALHLSGSVSPGSYFSYSSDVLVSITNTDKTINFEWGCEIDEEMVIRLQNSYIWASRIK